MNDHDVTLVLERLIEPVEDEVGNWDDVLGRAAEPTQERRNDVLDREAPALHRRQTREHSLGRHSRRRFLVLATAALVVAVASTSAFGTVRDLLFGARRSASTLAAGPTWSPDGRRIAFATACVSECAGPSPLELNVMNADGSGRRNLTLEWGLEGLNSSPYAVGSPLWSPDWRTIAFARDRGVWVNGLPHEDIYLIDADGSGLRRLTRSPALDQPIAWSPNGRKLAFRRIRAGGNPDARGNLEGRSDVYVVNADGSGLRRLARGVTFAFRTSDFPPESPAPAWSPNSRKIAFVSNRDGSDDIFVVNTDGSGLRNLTRSRGNDRKPAWSPDGREIAFRSNRDGNEEIYVIDVDGGGLRRLTHNSTSDSGAVWSPDGRKILFVRSRDPFCVAARFDFPCQINGDVYVMNADGSGQRNLTRSATHPFATDAAPAWSPDGRKILFVSNRDRNGEIYVMNANGGGKRNLTQLKGRG